VRAQDVAEPRGDVGRQRVAVPASVVAAVAVVDDSVRLNTCHAGSARGDASTTINRKLVRWLSGSVTLLGLNVPHCLNGERIWQPQIS
jgi:hypothetical protein